MYFISFCFIWPHQWGRMNLSNNRFVFGDNKYQHCINHIQKMCNICDNVWNSWGMCSLFIQCLHQLVILKDGHYLSELQVIPLPDTLWNISGLMCSETSLASGKLFNCVMPWGKFYWLHYFEIKVGSWLMLLLLILRKNICDVLMGLHMHMILRIWKHTQDAQHSDFYYLWRYNVCLFPLLPYKRTFH